MDHIDSIPQTIKYIHDTVFSKGENAYDLVYKIDYMYQNAWNRLIVVGGVILTIATIVIPWWLRTIRAKQAKVDKQNDRLFLEEKTKEIKSELNREFERRIAEELVKLSEGVQAELYSVKAANFFLLAESKMDKKDYSYAFINFITAIRYSIGSGDLGNIKGVLNNMVINCIPNMTVAGLTTTEKMYSFKIEDFLKEIESFDKDHILFDEVNRFRQTIGLLIQKEKKSG